MIPLLAVLPSPSLASRKCHLQQQQLLLLHHHLRFPFRDLLSIILPIHYCQSVYIYFSIHLNLRFGLLPPLFQNPATPDESVSLKTELTLLTHNKQQQETGTQEESYQFPTTTTSFSLPRAT